MEDYIKKANENNDLRIDLALLKAEQALEAKENGILKEQIASLKLQIGLLRSEVEKWKRRASAANKDRARMEHKELQRIKESEQQ